VFRASPPPVWPLGDVLLWGLAPLPLAADPGEVRLGGWVFAVFVLCFTCFDSNAALDKEPGSANIP